MTEYKTETIEMTMPISEVIRASVTAVVVAQEYDLEYLPRTLTALAAQILQPNQLILAVPEKAELSDQITQLAQHARAQIVEVGAQKNLATALQAALGKYGAQPDTGESNAPGNELAATPSAPAADAEWLWILHADSAPGAHALDRLLRRAESSARIGAVGPKQVGWADPAAAEPRELLEVGIRATRTARRVPEIEQDERDQGQLDARSDVLAVGTAGMLVRMSAYRKLGGLDPALGPFGDGLEFSRRLRHAGYRVLVQTDALVYHARASLGAEPEDSFAQRRIAQIYNALLAAPAGMLTLLTIGYVLAALPRSLARILMKQSSLAQAEIQAGLGVIAMRSSVADGRAAIAKVNQVPARALRDLEDTAADVRAAQRESQRTQQENYMLATRPDPLVIKAQADLRRHTRRGLALTAVFAAVLSLIFNLQHLSQGVLAGGQLANDALTAGGLWDILRTGWLPAGDGYPLAVDPLVVTWFPALLLGAPFGLNLGTLVTILYYLAIPAAAVAGYIFAGRMTQSWVTRMVLGAVWALSPSLLSALAQGQLAGIAAHIYLPLAGYAIIGAWRGSLSYLGLAALLGGLLTTAAPIFLPVLLLVAVIGLIVQRGKRWRWLWLPVPALALMAPVLPFARSYNFFFATPLTPVSGPRTALDIFQLFFTREFSTVPNWDWALFAMAGAVLLCAVLALLRHTRMWRIRIWWAIALLGFGLALIATKIPVGLVATPAGYEVTPAWAGIGLSVMWLGLVGAIGHGSYGLRTAINARGFGVTLLLGGLAMVLLPLALVGGAAQWAHIQLTEASTVHPAGDPLPAIGHEQQRNGLRVLALNPEHSGILAELWRGPGAQIHEYPMLRSLQELAQSQAASDGQHADLAHRHLATTVADLTTASTQAAQELGEHAVSVVLLPPDTSSKRDDFAAYLGTVPGMEYITENEAGAFWRVAAAELWAISADGNYAPVQNGDTWSQGAGTLQLAERRDAGWQAQIGDTKLTATGDGWAQAWDVPRGITGPIEVSYTNPIAYLNWLQLLGYLVSLIVALPVAQSRRSVE
ncbi:MAG: glycosyltransferase [Trueperella sp.]|nr:glycosyltransferase [Trueperella sp.]